MLAWLGILLLIAVCNSKVQVPDNEDNMFLTQSLFTAITQDCEEFYSEKGLKVGSDAAHFSVFASKLQAIEDSNNNVENTYLSAANCFTALNDDEMSHWLGAVPPSHDHEYDTTGRESNPIVGQHEDIPHEYDRRDDDTTTPAKSQGSCGSCWSFAAVAVLESAYLKLTGAKPSEVDFSEQQLLDCTYEGETGRDGCEGGWMTEAWWNLKNRHDNHLVSEVDKPYTIKDRTCSTAGLRNSFSKVEITKVWKSDDDSAITTPMGIQTAKDIYKVSAVAVAWRMETAFSSYKSGIFNTPCIDTQVDHALTLVGYSAEYFIGKNSWGTKWGEAGHIKLSRTTGNLCNFLRYVMYPEVKCRFGVDRSSGKCAENSSPTEAPAPLCTRRCYRGKECYIMDSSTGDMGCKCPIGFYGFNCAVKIKCEKKDKTRCSKKKQRWSSGKWQYKCNTKMGYKNCPHLCGHCDKN